MPQFAICRVNDLYDSYPDQASALAAAITNTKDDIRQGHDDDHAGWFVVEIQKEVSIIEDKPVKAASYKHKVHDV